MWTPLVQLDHWDFSLTLLAPTDFGNSRDGVALLVVVSAALNDGQPDSEGVLIDAVQCAVTMPRCGSGRGRSWYYLKSVAFGDLVMEICPTRWCRTLKGSLVV